MQHAATCMTRRETPDGHHDYGLWIEESIGDYLIEQSGLLQTQCDDDGYSEFQLNTIGSVLARSIVPVQA